jgi:hypothetical protein
LSVKQAAAYTGATVWAIRQLYWAKDILGFIAGRRLLISRESLDLWTEVTAQRMKNEGWVVIEIKDNPLSK